MAAEFAAAKAAEVEEELPQVGGQLHWLQRMFCCGQVSHRREVEVGGGAASGG